MPAPTAVKAPIHFARVSLKDALTHLYHGTDEPEALSRLEAVIQETATAIPKTGTAFTPESIILTTARHGALTARQALVEGRREEALGAVRATLGALSHVPAMIEVVPDEEGRA